MKSPKEKKDFLRRFVYSGDLHVSMIASALSQKGLQTEPSRQAFPDLISSAQQRRVGIETKRLTICKNPYERIREEVLLELKKETWKEPFLLLLIFPEFEKLQEKPWRVLQLASGCRFLEDVMAPQLQTRVLCQYVTAQSSVQYSFDSLIENLQKEVKTLIQNLEHLDTSSGKLRKQPLLGDTFFHLLLWSF